jgi:polyisoprenoid-binding protein YceI
MRRTFASVSVIAAFLASATAGQAADYAIDPTHSHILFTIDHLGFAKMVGLFSDFSGNISFDANNVPASKLNVIIKTDSLQTQFATRDKDLKGADWFNVTEFPEMTFVGTEFVKKDDHTGTVTGKLTLHGVTKPVTLNVVVNKVGQNPLRYCGARRMASFRPVKSGVIRRTVTRRLARSGPRVGTFKSCSP